MKLLTKEEEDAHYNRVLTGGFLGGFVGLTVGLAANAIAYRKSPFYRTLTLPLRTFFVSSSGTFGAIIEADRYSRHFENERTIADRVLLERRMKQLAEEQANMSKWEKAMALGKEYRYSIVSASWAASMAGSLALVSRDKYLTTAQKLVHARMYAQGLTLLILIATAAFEVSDARAAKAKRVLVDDPKHPGHQIEQKVHHESYAGEDLWKDMVEAEVKRQQARDAQAAAEEQQKLKH